jgi:hypothetical protein
MPEARHAATRDLRRMQRHRDRGWRVVMRLYDWDVAADVAEGRRVAPIGVSDQAQRAQQRMVEALREVPQGVTAHGWVTTMAYVPKLSGYQRYELAVQAERDASGTVRLITPR